MTFEIFYIKFENKNIKELKKNFISLIKRKFRNNGDWGLGIGDWGLGIGPNPKSPIPNPNPQSPFFAKFIKLFKKY